VDSTRALRYNQSLKLQRSQPQLLTPALKQYAIARYLASVPPRDLVTEIKSKFGVDVKVGPLRQWLTRSGLAARKRQVEARVCALVSSAGVETIAKASAAAPRSHLARWAASTVTIADKALVMAGEATKPRDLASSTAAASSAIKLFRICAGIDGPVQRVASTFNFDFSNLPAPRHIAVTPAGLTSISTSPGSPATELDVDIESDDVG
jgi:hypothetical protein